MCIIAVANQKGGTGKTTTCVNLGIGLARTGKKVLLVDADAQGSMAVSLGVVEPDNLDHTIVSIMEKVINDESIDDNEGIMHHEEGVDFIPANIELAGLETALVGVMSREFVLKSYLDHMKDKYDYILIDCMPSLGMVTINALVAADYVLIPVEAAYLSTKGLQQLNNWKGSPQAESVVRNFGNTINQSRSPCKFFKRYLRSDQRSVW